MAAVARKGPHRGVEDDQVVAHYARAGEASPGVIRIDLLVEDGGSAATTCILRAKPGRPLGRFAWGGTHEVLPPGLRVASALSIVLYGAVALVLLDAADVVDVLPGDWSPSARDPRLRHS